MTTFDSTREPLSNILTSIRQGKLQLPDFQRGWVWDDDHIRSLLASVTRSFPVGAVMLLQTGNPKVRFLPRPVEGAPGAHVAPEHLILDGQQRLTSLYQALFSGQVVQTRDSRKKAMNRWYYIDIRKALDPAVDREDAIVSLPEDRQLKNFRGQVTADYSTPEKECAAELMPLPLVFQIGDLTSWQLKYIQTEPQKATERLKRWNDFVQTVVQPLQQYQVPMIVLRKETSKEAVCQVFEKVNTGGVALNVFELLTATFAADNYNLRDDWVRRTNAFKGDGFNRCHLLKAVENTDFLQCISLLATYARRADAVDGGLAPENAPGVSCKRKDVLDLSLEDYQRWGDPATDGFKRAARLLHDQKLFAAWDLPYRTQLVPLAAAFAVLGNAADGDGAKSKLARWYWCGVFGELYGGGIESRFAKDLSDLVSWVRGGDLEPATVADANFTASRLLTLRSRNSAAYKGVLALQLAEGGRDFRTGDKIEQQNYFDDKVDIHHIFPQKWCTDRGLARQRFDSIVNKTPLSATTNRMVGANAPSVYLGRMEKSASIPMERMNEILNSHLIDPRHLRADSFEAFFAARAEALLTRIERATGKKTNRDIDFEQTPESGEYGPDVDDEALIEEAS